MSNYYLEEEYVAGVILPGGSTTRSGRQVNREISRVFPITVNIPNLIFNDFRKAEVKFSLISFTNTSHHNRLYLQFFL